MKYPLILALSLAATPVLAQPVAAPEPEIAVSFTGQQLQRLIQAEVMLDPVLAKLIKAQDDLRTQKLQASPSADK